MSGVEMDAFFQKIDGERRGGFSLLPEGCVLQVFTLEGGAFRPFFERGPTGHRYSFLEENPEVVTPLFDRGVIRLPDSFALWTGGELWMFVDSVEHPTIVLILELPPSLSFSEDFLRLLILPDLLQLRKDLDDLPVWLAALIPALFRAPSPLLLISEEGSGRQQLLVFLEKYRFGGSAVRFSPGRIAEEVQLRELFGDAVGERLRSSAAIPLIDRGQTLLIEEVSNLSKGTQLRLLSALSKEDRFWIFDTSRSLDAMVDAGQFDGALNGLLKQNRIVLPPLRQQGELLREEAIRYMGRLFRQHGRRIQLTEDALAAILQYEWVGNLQEFYETLAAAYLLTRTEWIEAGDLKFGLWYRSEEDALNLRRRTEELERKLLLEAHAIHGGNQVHMARSLGISRGSLQYRWSRLGVEEADR